MQPSSIQWWRFATNKPPWLGFRLIFGVSFWETGGYGGTPSPGGSIGVIELGENVRQNLRIAGGHGGRGKGNEMRWNYRSQGATFGEYVEAGRQGRGSFLGGLTYERRSFEKVDAATIASILVEWLNSPSMGPERLRGKQWVADKRVTYPGEEIMVDPGPEIATRMASAIAQIPSRQASAPIILGTATRMLDQRYIEPLSDLGHQAAKSVALQRIGAFAAGMLDVLDPGRTPIGA